MQETWVQEETCLLRNLWVKLKLAQSYPTICNPMDYTVHEILQARRLEWVAYPFSSGSSRPRNWTRVSCITGGFFKYWAIREALRNMNAGQEATVRTRHRTTDWFQFGKGVHQGCMLSSCLFNLYAEYIMRNVGLDEPQAEIRISGKNIKTSQMQMTPPLWQKVKRS